MNRLLRSTRGRNEPLKVAAAHIEAAVAHINNAAQALVPADDADESSNDKTSELRLLVCALADIRSAIQAHQRANPQTGGALVRHIDDR